MPEMDADETTVIFRKDSKYGVFALFPDMPADYSELVTYYAHVGQHSAADYSHCIRSSRPANVEEYAELKQELEYLGYNLQIRKRRIR